VISYDVLVSREGKFWVAVVDGVRGGATESRRLSNLEVEVRDLLAGLLDVEPEELDLHFQFAPALSPSAAEALQSYRAAADELAESKRRYEETQRQAVDELQSAHVSVRDAAYLTDLSFQRISQLLGVVGAGAVGSSGGKRTPAKATARKPSPSPTPKRSAVPAAASSRSSAAGQLKNAPGARRPTEAAAKSPAARRVAAKSANPATPAVKKAPAHRTAAKTGTSTRM
jgi:hypothetical protein